MLKSYLLEGRLFLLVLHFCLHQPLRQLQCNLTAVANDGAHAGWIVDRNGL
jgi:hypothetical protein